MTRTEWTRRRAANEDQPGSDCWNDDHCYRQAFRFHPDATRVELDVCLSGLYRHVKVDGRSELVGS